MILREENYGGLTEIKARRVKKRMVYVNREAEHHFHRAFFMETSHFPEILIIADQGRNAKVLADYLRKGGFSVKEASMNAPVTPVFPAADLILLQLFDPSTDVMTVMHDVKGIYETPLIAITSNDHYSTAVEALSMGLDDVLGAPFHAFEVILRVQAVLRRKDRCFSLDRLNEVNKEIICS